MVATPLAEMGSEGITVTTQNLITGKPITENLSESLFGGLFFGTAFGSTPFTTGLLMNTFSTDANRKEWHEYQNKKADLTLTLDEVGGKLVLNENGEYDVQSLDGSAPSNIM